MFLRPRVIVMSIMTITKSTRISRELLTWVSATLLCETFPWWIDLFVHGTTHEWRFMVSILSSISLSVTLAFVYARVLWRSGSVAFSICVSSCFCALLCINIVGFVHARAILNITSAMVAANKEWAASLRDRNAGEKLVEQLRVIDSAHAPKEMRTGLQDYVEGLEEQLKSQQIGEERRIEEFRALAARGQREMYNAYVLYR